MSFPAMPYPASCAWLTLLTQSRLSPSLPLACYALIASQCANLTNNATIAVLMSELRHSFPSTTFDSSLYCLVHLLASPTTAPAVIAHPSNLFDTLSRILEAGNHAQIQRCLVLLNNLFRNGMCTVFPSITRHLCQPSL
jgi:hypothetical protein